ncbi:hypothetical protein [Micromonospora vulcania]|uniref:Uncharacterized protein n=1 Tax=Micromonospora vulcania TaxID=1441873 RepID=A0ABW1H1H6_9ACTN
MDSGGPTGPHEVIPSSTPRLVDMIIHPYARHVLWRGLEARGYQRA